MDKLIFRYDVMYFTKDWYELKRFKRKPFLKIISDIFITKTSFVLCIIPLLAFLFFLMDISLKTYHVTPTVVIFFLYTIMIYYEQHKNVNILTDSIQKIYVDESKKKMRIAYRDPNGLRIRVVDMPNEEREYRNLVNQMKERNLFIIELNETVI